MIVGGKGGNTWLELLRENDKFPFVVTGTGTLETAESVSTGGFMQGLRLLNRFSSPFRGGKR
jgi:hypothetical protein